MCIVLDFSQKSNKGKGSGVCENCYNIAHDDARCVIFSAVVACCVVDVWCLR